MTRKRIHRLLQDWEHSMAAAPSDPPNAVPSEGAPFLQAYVASAGCILERQRKHPKTLESFGNQDMEEIHRWIEKKHDLEAEANVSPSAIASIRELRNIYLHGLQTVSALQDLQDAPDAILPGNFIAPSPSTSESQ